MAAVEWSEIQILDVTSNDETVQQVARQSKKIDYPCCKATLTSRMKVTSLKSKSAVLALYWSFLAGVLQLFYSDPSAPISILFTYIGGFRIVETIGSIYACFALLQLFYPLAGMLADLRYGRYKCVIGSLWCLIIGIVFFLVVSTFSSFYLPFAGMPWTYAILAVVLLALGVPTVVGLFLFFASIVAFNANVIQFGLDQLRDSPTKHLVLYIHWYVLLYYSGRSVFRLTIQPLGFCQTYILVAIPVIICVLSYLLLLLSLCVGYRKRHTWFLKDTGSSNPYILVYKVIQFAKRHRHPVHRSAFTYCEDELPSRLDFGKEKYGGPFTTEQVENVKVFLRILLVLLSLGPVFAVERSTSILLPIFSAHVSGDLHSCPSFVISDILPLFLIIFLAVFYIVILRPHVCYWILGILKRMWFGMLLLTIPILFYFTVDTVSHTSISHSSECFLTVESSTRNNSLNASFGPGIKSPLFFIPNLFYSLGFLIFHIAVFEFICSQSPHSMKGLLIGTFYAIRGIFQLLGALLFMFPFLGWRSSSSFPSCGFAYYLINIIVAIIGVVLYTWAARRYQNRQRDEPDNVYRYAEEYYEKGTNEPSSGYDNYDNLNVHTID